MLKSCLLLLLCSVVLACNKPCLDLCFPNHSEKFCFDMCSCSSPILFRSEIVTEDARHFQVAAIPPITVQNDDGYYYLNCNVNCGEVCFRFATGYALLNCVVGHCGCGALVAEVFPQPAQPIYQPQSTTPVAPPQVPTAPQPAAPIPQPAPQVVPVAQPVPVAPQPTPVAPQPAPVSPQPAPVTPQPAPATPQPAPATPQPVPVAPQPAAPQPTPSTITMPFTTQDGRTYEIRPLVSDTEFFQSGCAACVDTCARIHSYDLVLRCLGFCSCQTQVSEVRPSFHY